MAYSFKGGKGLIDKIIAGVLLTILIIFLVMIQYLITVGLYG